jgi:hypothetical protein
LLTEPYEVERLTVTSPRPSVFPYGRDNHVT